jgi:hypothetical protein
MNVSADLLSERRLSTFYLIHHPDEPGWGLRRDVRTLAHHRIHHPREADGVLLGLNQQAACVGGIMPDSYLGLFPPFRPLAPFPVRRLRRRTGKGASGRGNW